MKSLEEMFLENRLKETEIMKENVIREFDDRIKAIKELLGKEREKLEEHKA